MAKAKSKSDARQRIVETAERLFYAEGTRAVGIDRIIAESEVAKMTLYNHFSSKDDLILAVLHYREQQFDAMFGKSMQRHVKKGLNGLEALFAALRDWFRKPNYRGCSFINATVELADADHPASAFAAGHKRRFHQMIEKVVVSTYGAKAADLAPAVALIVEGAIVTSVMQQSSGSADVAKVAAMLLFSEETARRG